MFEDALKEAEQDVSCKVTQSKIQEKKSETLCHKIHPLKIQTFTKSQRKTHKITSNATFWEILAHSVVSESEVRKLFFFWLVFPPISSLYAKLG